MEANVWGPGAWLFLHSITLNYPDNPSIYEKKIYKDFFNSLTNILPCDICRQNYKKHIQKFPIKFFLNSKIDLTKWLVKIHNLTNIDLNKSTISYNSFIKLYKNLYSKSKFNYYILLGCFIPILVYVIYKYNIK